MSIFCFVLFLLSAPEAFAAGAEISFLQAATCALCHSRIESTENPDLIGPYPLWSGSMMAHASRDPFWRAKVRYEAGVTPAASRVIEDKCLRCHAPAQQYGRRFREGGMALQDLARDAGEGVTCTVCHQIVPDGLGTRESFTGGFRIDTEDRVFGPHANPFLMPMLHHTGYTATQGKQLLEAALCGSCHTVITPTLAADGRATGEFIEQAPYLEWLASDYPAAGITCQSCHVPVLKRGAKPAAQYIAHMPPGGPFPPTLPRSPFGLHFFAGANVEMLDVLSNQIPDEAAVLRRNSERAREMLRSALDLTVTPILSGNMLAIAVEVRNLTGHKLPTGFPSRRIWLDLRVLAADGSTLFESGAWKRRSGDLVAAAPQPHRAVISQPEQTMVYEATYLDTAGRPTMSLLRAASYAKDNRIPPRGFDPAHNLPRGLTSSRIQPAGLGDDTGFLPGVHRVRYEYRSRSQSPPAKVRVEAWYQSISPAHAAALTAVDHAEIQAFQANYSGAGLPVLAASAEAAVSPKSDK